MDYFYPVLTMQLLTFATYRSPKRVSGSILSEGRNTAADAVEGCCHRLESNHHESISLRVIRGFGSTLNIRVIGGFDTMRR
jgi:hypothetical protein